MYLAYVCEARPYTTEKFAANAGKSCHFPFRREAGGQWLHSCVYEKNEKGNNYVWCPTSVDAEGVMIKDEVGECVDERDTAYAGVGKNMCCHLLPSQHYLQTNNFVFVSRRGQYMQDTVLL